MNLFKRTKRHFEETIPTIFHRHNATGDITILLALMSDSLTGYFYQHRILLSPL